MSSTYPIRPLALTCVNIHRFLLKQDLDFLTSIETIDYSLLLGRYPAHLVPSLPQPESFVSGVTSADGKWVYRMCIVDFLWNVKQLHPKIIQIAGVALPEQTVTTVPSRYREEFEKMVEEYVTVVEDGQGVKGGPGEDEGVAFES